MLPCGKSFTTKTNLTQQIVCNRNMSIVNHPFLSRNRLVRKPAELSHCCYECSENELSLLLSKFLIMGKVWRSLLCLLWSKVNCLSSGERILQIGSCLTKLNELYNSNACSGTYNLGPSLLLQLQQHHHNNHFHLLIVSRDKIAYAGPSLRSAPASQSWVWV